MPQVLGGGWEQEWGRLCSGAQLGPAHSSPVTSFFEGQRAWLPRSLAPLLVPLVKAPPEGPGGGSPQNLLRQGQGTHVSLGPGAGERMEG